MTSYSGENSNRFGTSGLSLTNRGFGHLSRVVERLGLIAGLTVWSAVKLLRESGVIFFQRSPIEPEEIREVLDGIGDVERIEDLHVWSLSSRISVASVYVTDSTTLDERERSWPGSTRY